MTAASTNARLPRVAINGFGRIGRTIMRIAKLRGHYDVVAVNDLASPEQLAYAFKYDSTHGIFPGEVSVNGEAIHSSRPHDVSSLTSNDGHRVRITRGQNGALYAIVIGTVTAEVTIPGLPSGNVTLLGAGTADRVPGTLDTIAFSGPPPDGPAFVLRFD